MGTFTRRGVLGAGAVVVTGVAAPLVAAAADGRTPAPVGSVLVRPGDPRYADLVRRGNRRFVGRPDHVRVVSTTEQVVHAVQEAVDTGRRVAVRSGGHCFENFVDDPAVKVVIDTSFMDGVYYDAGRRAYAVEAGATLGEVYRRLYLSWGVTVPAGACPGVGAGGHIVGGGFGPLGRLHGLSVDHLYGVEVVVVDRSGRARAVVATREPDDPHRDLWWAHTGGGGGNFGVVTRYWFRDLPPAPDSVLSFTVTWRPEALTGLARGFGAWCERHSASGSPYARVYAEMVLRRSPGPHLLAGQVAGGPDAERLADDFIAALARVAGAPQSRTQEMTPWLASVRQPGGDDGKQWRLKVKSAYLRRSLSGAQLAAAQRHLTCGDYDNPGGSLSLNTHGGRINAVPPEASATAHRDAVMKAFYLVAWSDPAEDDRHVAWIREFYRDMYADTGGVPVADGAYINYPDTDLADPAWNASGVPWHALYYGDNYARLRRVKARWDPRDVFRHALAIRA
ncbi:FAD-binding oxidoreductase [Phytohabitans rumicis]|uniref:FAD-linked oxidase n=1 Tax=Phytohabitans rumicis TaxID=1076125 RepID=A0A6V8L6I8_9ACTN|nr:BBE domain-containing protein [Phytohabitans rumicis]GFJ92853.1 FAD-linked oxidase [Phytohabitans rumicis]